VASTAGPGELCRQAGAAAHPSLRAVACRAEPHPLSSNSALKVAIQHFQAAVRLACTCITNIQHCDASTGQGQVQAYCGPRKQGCGTGGSMSPAAPPQQRPCGQQHTGAMLGQACLVTRGKRESLLFCRRCCSRWLQLAGMLTLARVRAGQHREAREPARVQGGDGGAAGPRDRDRAAEAAAGGHVRRHLQLPHQAVRGRAGPGRGAPPSATPVLGHKP